jgi:hypothetical protein
VRDEEGAAWWREGAGQLRELALETLEVELEGE